MSTFFADEGPVEAEFNPGIAARLPRKTVAAGALIRDPDGRFLFVVPNYKPFLDLPGGIVEDGEPPSVACKREVFEELGVVLAVGRLLVVDWTPGRGPWSDQVQFVFDGGVISSPLTPAPDELLGVRWLTLPEAAPSLRASLHRRLSLAQTALETGTVIHAEMGLLNTP